MHKEQARFAHHGEPGLHLGSYDFNMFAAMKKGMDFGTEVVFINSQGSFFTTNGKYQLHVLAESSNTPL